MFYQIDNTTFIRLDEIAEITFSNKAIKVRFVGTDIIRNYEISVNDEQLYSYIKKFKNVCKNYRNFLSILYKTGKIK
jgi:hypothetical protein